MKRRAFVVALAHLPVAGAGWAQAPAKRYRLGIIAGGGNPRSTPFYAAFEARLLELGWVDGKNLSVDFEAAESPAQLAAIAKRMVQQKADVIMTVGPEPALKAASEATRTVPIMAIALNYDPVGRGYVSSLARPGGNITGIAFRSPEESVKQLELVRQAIPRATRVAVLATGLAADQISPLDAAASRLQLRLDKFRLTAPYDFEAAFAAVKAQGADAVLVVGDPVTHRERVRIAKAALANGLPVVGGLGGVVVGFLVGYGPDLNATLRRGAEYVDKLLRGGKAAEMPVEWPTKFELVINLKTAKLLGLTIPPALLARADEVLK